MKRPEIKISIPDNLKVQLVDDWEAITKNQQVRPLRFMFKLDWNRAAYEKGRNSSYPCHACRMSR